MPARVSAAELATSKAAGVAGQCVTVLAPYKLRETPTLCPWLIHAVGSADRTTSQQDTEGPGHTSFRGGAGRLKSFTGQLHALGLDFRAHRLLTCQHAGDSLAHLGRPRLSPGLPVHAQGVCQGPVWAPTAHDQPRMGCLLEWGCLHPGRGSCTPLLLQLLLLLRM